MAGPPAFPKPLGMQPANCPHLLLLCQAGILRSNLITDLLKIPINSIDHRVALATATSPAHERAPAIIRQGLDEQALVSGPHSRTRRATRNQLQKRGGGKEETLAVFFLKFLPHFYGSFFWSFSRSLCSFSLTRLLPPRVPLSLQKQMQDIRKTGYSLVTHCGAWQQQRGPQSLGMGVRLRSLWLQLWERNLQVISNLALLGM